MTTGPLFFRAYATALQAVTSASLTSWTYFTSMSLTTSSLPLLTKVSVFHSG